MSGLRIALFGLGHVGSVTAAKLSSRGHFVMGVDVRKDRVKAINTGQGTVIEPGLSAMLSRGFWANNLRATMDPMEALEDAHISVVCVPTPSQAAGTIAFETDLSFLMNVAQQIGRGLERTNSPHYVVIRSTVPPGTMLECVAPIIERESKQELGHHWSLFYMPEFLREGTALADYENPTRTLIGICSESSRVATDLLVHTFFGRDRLGSEDFNICSAETAEAIKLIDNAFHALKVGFANEIARLCEVWKLDAHLIMHLVANEPKLNASPAYLRPGFAFGGSCLPKDLRILTDCAAELPILRAILASNEITVEREADKIAALKPKRVAVLGLAYKEGTADARESPYVKLVDALEQRGLEVRTHDPLCLARTHAIIAEAIEGADVIVVGQNAEVYRGCYEDWALSGRCVIVLEEWMQTAAFTRAALQERIASRRA